ncbi:HAMP domain-containing sensor histidine kinase [Aestuariibacter sp. A3R04]|uniref:sensor histidine kinase n=1 Tax=Aestuariibacter sp. A3R04 TaxID=2841571 RepID=UPI001C0842F0|nr:HAMP domain-containing sensor histidine kinase [Aestuariibacter sp. A3R04]MBU3021392.1 HAMP domain-containing histidine kinase [Aestuariibacter sp. A3R04]
MVEGLRFSLRKYVVLTLLAVAGVIFTLFSIQSADSFLDGMDGMLRNSMLRAARSVDVEPGAPTQVLDFHIASTYADIPETIKQSFSETEIAPYKLYKDIDKPSIFSRPRSANFLVMVPGEERRKMFVSQRFEAPPEDGNKSFRIGPQLHSILVGVAALGAFAVALFLLLRSVSRPVESLQQWAAGLDEAQLDAPIPNFRYKELNALAGIIHMSLQRVRQTLEREREFVNHASHELRTPIAVVRSSIELLCRVVDVENSKGRNAVSRIDNASKTMADLTETLLWLGREDTAGLPETEVDVADMVKGLTADLKYLLQGKSVTLSLHLSPCYLILPETATQIVIGNIIRNAFQHTYQGKVDIQLHNDQLVVTNCEDGALADSRCATKTRDGEEGFGIGLKLIEKLSRKLNWGYQPAFSENGYSVTLHIRSFTPLKA